MQDSIQIRPAKPTDAEPAAVLLYSAYVHMQVDYPLSEEHEAGWIEHLRAYFRQEGNRFSYQNTLVAAQGEEVVGLVLSFGGRDEVRLNTAAGRWLEREAEDDEWYVDALAVFTAFGHRGIGARLLQDAEQQAHLHHYSKVALNVAEDNIPALHLYTRLQYVVTRHTVIYHRPYKRMVKTLEA